MKLFIAAVAACTAVASALPTATVTGNEIMGWNPELAEFLSVVDKHVQNVRSAASSTPPSCDLSKAQIPVAPTPLTAPDAGTKLALVAVGRGVQNYTCADTQITTKPVLVGAVAKLYDASCVAANYPDILALMPNLALQFPLPPQPDANLEPSNVLITGHHFFDASTPVFDLETIHKDLGIVYAVKIAAVPAPPDAPKGQNGAGDGSVAWLKLATRAPTTNGWKNVYRVNTAGGNPPPTCQSSPAYFSVQYAAEYWFYQAV